MQEHGEKQTPRLYTCNQFHNRHQWVSVASLRWLIFKRDTNGLEASGAIVRLGRKVLIDEANFFTWLKNQQKAA